MKAVKTVMKHTIFRPIRWNRIALSLSLSCHGLFRIIVSDSIVLYSIVVYSNAILFVLQTLGMTIKID
jgi:hypothetical protein